ncbi:hypothetical protein STEG23_007952, partial [Scotinomys teguina]
MENGRETRTHTGIWRGFPGEALLQKDLKRCSEYRKLEETSGTPTRYEFFRSVPYRPMFPKALETSLHSVLTLLSSEAR